MPLASWLPTLISAGASLIGGRLGSKSTAAANKANIDQQRDFAQNSIQWRVDDAKKAGIHPAFALGAPTMSFAPSSVGDSAMPQAFANMGQDIARAGAATATSQSRMDAELAALALTRAGLENDLLRAQIGRIGRETGPAFPGTELLVPGQGDVPVQELKLPVRTTALGGIGGATRTYPGLSDAQVYEDRHGDLVQEVYGIRNWIADHFPGAVKALNYYPPPMTGSGRFGPGYKR